MLKIKPFEGKCSKCARHERQISKLTKAFITADDENVRRCKQCEAMIRRFKAEHNSDKSEQKAGVRRG